MSTPSDRNLAVLHLIIDTVSEAYKLQANQIVQSRRNAQPRHIIVFFARRHTLLTCKSIGKHLNGRNHATISHSYKWVTQLCEVDRSFCIEVNELETQLKIKLQWHNNSTQ